MVPHEGQPRQTHRQGRREQKHRKRVGFILWAQARDGLIATSTHAQRAPSRGARAVLAWTTDTAHRCVEQEGRVDRSALFRARWHAVQLVS